MTSTEFEKKAKAAVSKVMKDQFSMEVPINSLEMVWFGHVLGNKKCTLYSEYLGEYYPEVTYAYLKGEIYVDIYKKCHHGKLTVE